jgi:outer membrane protein OmpA-like peptidoglycan-associated protein
MSPKSYPTLDEIVNFLTENPLVVIEVGGHTNNIPTDEFCDVLSSARAKAVSEFIVKKGIDANRVLYKGYGKREPKYSNNHKEGRSKNQRVEIKILTLQ